MEAPAYGGISAEEDRELTKVFGPSGPFNGGVDVSDVSPVLRFYNALFISGFLSAGSDGPKPEKLDYSASVDLLRGLESSDPGNGAFPFFEAAILKRMGASDEIYRKTLERAAQAPRFDDFSSRLSRAVMKKGLNSAALFLQAFAVVSRMPIPDYSSADNYVIDEIKSSDEKFAAEMMTLGETLMRGGRENVDSPEFYYWSLIQYAIGHRIYESALNQIHPGEPLPEEIWTAKKMSQHNRKYLETFDFYDKLYDWAQAALEKGARLDVKNTSCPRGQIDKVVEQLREVFKNEPK